MGWYKRKKTLTCHLCFWRDYKEFGSSEAERKAAEAEAKRGPNQPAVFGKGGAARARAERAMKEAGPDESSDAKKVAAEAAKRKREEQERRVQ